MNQGPALGIDLGGTKIYAVVTDENNKIIGEGKEDTDFSAGPEKIVADLLALGEKTLEGLHLRLSDVKYIGAAIPSPVWA